MTKIDLNGPQAMDTNSLFHPVVPTTRYLSRHDDIQP
jgi:hypothetical protein